MTAPPPATATTAPSWATTRTQDDDAIEYRSHIGDVVPPDDLETLSVDVVQRDEIPDTAAASVNRSPARISLAGIRMTPAEPRTLTHLLTTALTTINNR